jgi:hypothetical protein
MTCRIERVDDRENSVVFRVTGRIKSEHVETLRALVAGEVGRLAIDLAEVILVNRKVVRFLALCAENRREERRVRRKRAKA